MENLMIGKIYGLFDERTDRVRYVGKTQYTVEGRLGNHIKEAMDSLVSPKCDWIRELLAIGLRPYVQVLETVEGTLADLNEAERWWIASLKTGGYDLTNISDGGDGGFYGPHTQETKEKMSRTRKGRTQTAEWVQKRVASTKLTWEEEGHPLEGKRPSEATIEGARQARLEDWKDPVYREFMTAQLRMCASKGGSSPKNTESKIGRRQSPDTIVKRIAKTTGKKRTPEQLQHYRDAWTPEKKLLCGVHSKRRADRIKEKKILTYTRKQQIFLHSMGVI
jgi:hypothetical protein